LIGYVCLVDADKSGPAGVEHVTELLEFVTIHAGLVVDHQPPIAATIAR
jgi:hypothetical protein